VSDCENRSLQSDITAGTCYKYDNNFRMVSGDSVRDAEQVSDSPGLSETVRGSGGVIGLSAQAGLSVPRTVGSQFQLAGLWSGARHRDLLCGVRVGLRQTWSRTS